MSRKRSPEVREKLRQIAIKRWQDPEYRAAHLPRLKEMTAAYIRKCAERRQNPEAHKLSRPVGRPPGTKQPPEAVEKTRQATIRRWQDPEYRARHLPHFMAVRAGDAVAAANARRRVRPPKGTPEYHQYEKIRAILGIEAARSIQW